MTYNEKILNESAVIKEPTFEHGYRKGRVFATDSTLEMKNIILSSSKALRILYDKKKKFYIYGDVDDYIHRKLLEIAWEYMLYPEFPMKWQITGGYFEDYTTQLIFAPTNLVNETAGASIGEDGYTDRIVYDFGVITGRDENRTECLSSIPLIKSLKNKQIRHEVRDGWESDGYTPKIKVLSDNTKSVSDPLTEDTIKLKNGKWANVGKDGKRDSGTFKTKKKANAQRKAMFANGFKESLDTNNIISLLSNTFGTVDEPQPTAMYILPNGRFLFTTPLEPSDDCDYEIDEHRNIDDFLYHKNIIKDDRYLEDDGSLFTENVLNCIRFNITDEYYGNYSYIQLNKKQPTSQQYDSLLKIFDYVINHGYKYLSIIFDNQYGKQIKLELNNYTSDELLKKIKRFYVSGILTENKNKQLMLQDIFPYTNKTSENLNEAKNTQTISNDKNKEFYKVKPSREIGKKIATFSNYIVLELNIGKCETYQLSDVEAITINSQSDITAIDNSSLQPIPREIEIKTTKQFDSDCKDLKLLDKKDEIKEYLYSNKPDASLGRGLYKIRVRIKEENRGQSGSYRVIFFYKKGTICYILTMYAKNQKDNITERELKELKKYIEKIIEVN